MMPRTNGSGANNITKMIAKDGIPFQISVEHNTNVTYCDVRTPLGGQHLCYSDIDGVQKPTILR